MRALISGGGIGGLTTAVALQKVGIETTVFERSLDLDEAGFGLILGANAMKVLESLDLTYAVRRTGARVTTGTLFSSKGRVLARLSAEELRRRVGEDSYAIHRADLQRILLSAAGSENVLFDASLATFEQDAGIVKARLSDGRELSGDLLVGADGIHSTVRETLFGPANLRYAGYTAWRGLSRPEKPLPEGEDFEAWGEGVRFGCAGIDAEESPGGRVYWFATRNAPPGEKDGPRGVKEDLLQLLRGWPSPVEEVVSSTPQQEIRRDDIFDCKPLPTWSRTRTTLLGDAAHPMTPNLGQGACQAMEDAAALAYSLENEIAVEAALRRYEKVRARRARRISTLSRNLGRVGQLENPLLCALRNVTMRLVPEELELRRFEEVLAGPYSGTRND